MLLLHLQLASIVYFMYVFLIKLLLFFSFLLSSSLLQRLIKLIYFIYLRYLPVCSKVCRGRQYFSIYGLID